MRRTGAGCVIIHHTSRTTGQYADSRQIGASADVILTMAKDPNNGLIRKIESIGRVRTGGPFSIRWEDPWYELEKGELSLEMKAYKAVVSDPGMGATKLRAAIGGSARAADALVSRMLAQGLLEDRAEVNGQGDVIAHHYWPRVRISESGHRQGM
jgi:hypothetical protein